jgi:hypothetical protein
MDSAEETEGVGEGLCSVNAEMSRYWERRRYVIRKIYLKIRHGQNIANPTFISKLGQ